MRKKCRPVRDESGRRVWNLQHGHCQACGRTAGAWGREWGGLSTHHIVKFRRSDEDCNYLRLCGRCHELAEGARIPHPDGGHWPLLTQGVCLTLKRTRESQQWNPARLAELFGRALPCPEPIPSLIEQEYRRNRPWDTARFAHPCQSA
jgi:hypothetical protein